MLQIKTTSTREAHGVICVSVAGDIDAGTAEQLRGALDSVGERHPAVVELDLGRVTFFSCAGLTALLAARQAVPDVIIVVASRQVHRILDILQLRPLFGSPASANPGRQD